MPVVQGPSEVFRIVDDRDCIKHETLPWNRFLLHGHHCDGNQWAVTPKLTMIAGAGNFPSGSSRCESFLFNPTIADEGAESECGKGRKMRGRAVNRAQKNIS